jgi:hypothetical protein
MNDLDALGRRIAGLQDRRLADPQREPGPCSTALGEHLLRRARERRRRRGLATAALAALLLLAGGYAALRPRPLVWPEAALAKVRAEAGQRVVAPEHDLAIAFDDGSQVVLSSGTSMHTEALGPAHARLRLERGRATVRVAHTRGTHYTVRAGAYVITVTGTRFRLGWRPESGALSLAVDEGSVLLSGVLMKEPVAIRAGQSVAFEQERAVGSVLGARQGTQEGPSESRAEAVPPEEPGPGFVPVAPAVVPPPHVRHPTVKTPTAVSPSWQAHAEAGHYREALAEAERVGYPSLCRAATASDLLTLAEAARYAGRAERAEQALAAVRARYAQSEDAAVAAYLLGRIAAEHRRDHAWAARWFRTYLAERPGGRLDREAEGRLLESLAFLDRNQARAAARAYLEHHPRGPHAAFARNLLGP